MEIVVKIETNILCSVNLVVFEIMWKNVVESVG